MKKQQKCLKLFLKMNKLLIFFILSMILISSVNAVTFNEIFKEFSNLITGKAIQPLECSTNDECNDLDPCTNDICNNPGTVNSFCSYTQISPCIGNNVCEADENCNSPDCPCNTGYSCINNLCHQQSEYCEDNTTINECSVDKPLYCDFNNLTLVNNCQKCGCSFGYSCSNDNSCTQVMNDCEIDNGNCLNSCSANQYEDTYLSSTCDPNFKCCKEKPIIQQGTCSDNLKNQDEIGIDCGGICEKKCELTKLDFKIPKLTTTQKSGIQPYTTSIRKQNLVLQNSVVDKEDIVIRPVAKKFSALPREEVTIKAEVVENKIKVDVSDVKMELAIVDEKPRLTLNIKTI